MVEYGVNRLDRVFHALAHPTRRRILKRLQRGEQTIGEIAAPFPVSLEAVSKHVQVLERAGLVKRAPQGRVHRCTMDPKPLRGAARVLAELSGMWNQRLDRLETLLLETQERD
jgi:DNA-binding transcriptional ArsR family regulator